MYGGTMRWEILDRYMRQECGLAERAYVEDWLAASPARRKLLEQLATLNGFDCKGSSAGKAAVWARLELELDPGLKQRGDDA